MKALNDGISSCVMFRMATNRYPTAPVSPFCNRVIALLGLIFVTFLAEDVFSRAVEPGHASLAPALAAGTLAWSNHASERRVQPGFLVEQSSHPASEAIDKAKAAEIKGRDWDDDRRTRKFLELVVLPLGVCLTLVMVLRRGFLN